MKKLACLLYLIPAFSFAQITFEDVAQDVNLNWEGKSFGASWADVTGDGFPDLFMQCHSNYFDAYFNDDLPRYYFNNAGSFVQQEILDEIPETDWHGGMMFDLDKDGDLDHLSVTGGSSANIFFVNDNGNFNYENQAVEFGLDNEGGVGRSPSVIDANNDGFLDVLLNDLDHGPDNVGPRLLISNSGVDFTDSTAEYNLDWLQSSFSVSNDLLGNNSLNVIYLIGKATVTTLSENQFQEEFQFPLNRVYDFTLNDFNGDLMPDIFLARASKYDVFDKVNDDLIRGYVSYTPANEVIELVFSAETETPVLNIFPRNTSTDYMVVAGNSTSNYFEGEEANIELNTALNGFIGVPAIEDTLTVPHIYIGYDQDQNNWVLRFASGFPAAIEIGIELMGENVEIVSTSGLADVVIPDQLYVNEGEYSFNPVLQNLFDSGDNSISTISADFDNDMDIDIYVVRSTYADNKLNILYENINNENFVRHEGAWGAAGDGPGIGETANSVDFNNDGFMDIYLTNGASTFFLDSAAVNLYQNSGNSNNWIKLILEGVVSNNLGLHSKVLVYAGGVAQMRYQNGGFHRYSQDDNRLHFGLGQNPLIDSIVIDWPSGIHQVLEDVEPNQILTIEEDLFTSAEERGFDESLIRLYPNPSNGKLQIDCPASTLSGIKAYDVQGRLVLEESNISAKNPFALTISTGRGIYTLEIITDKGSSKKKIVVL